ncbi:MAG: hypothetical protein QMD14_03575 [Candidatus Aenigmarchaeota archaeon]|nr:hypothetical protein [Candidatus Aenigmarchaeota archaeon]
MQGQVRIDEFVFVLLAGIVLILIFIFAWGIPPAEEKAPPVPPPVIGEVPIRAVYEPGVVEIKYALGLDILTSKENVEVAAGLFTSEEISLVATLTEGKLAEVTDAFVVIIVESTNKLKPLIITVNEKEIYRDIPEPGTLLIPVGKDLLKLKNIVTIKTEFPGILKFWQTSKYRLEEAKFGVNIFGPAFKDYEFSLEKYVIKYFKYGRLEYDVVDRIKEKNLIVKINDQQLLKGVQLIGSYERSFGPAYVKEGKNVLSFSAEPGAEYKLKNIVLTIVYERR